MRRREVFTVCAKNLLLPREIRLVYAALCFYLYVLSLDILYLYPPSGPHWACNGITLPLPLLVLLLTFWRLNYFFKF